MKKLLAIVILSIAMLTGPTTAQSDLLSTSDPIDTCKIGLDILKTGHQINYPGNHGVIEFYIDTIFNNGTYIKVADTERAGYELTAGLYKIGCPYPVIFRENQNRKDYRDSRSYSGKWVADASGRHRYVQNDRQYLALPVDETELRSSIFTQ